MFGKRIDLFKILGFQVRIDFSWVIIAIIIAWSLSTGFFPFYLEGLSTGTYWAMGIVGALGLFLSIIFHEFSHSMVARRYGIPMKGITLFIFGGMAEMGEEPTSPKGEFMMAIAGPISSLAISGAFYAISVVGVQVGIPVPVNGVIQYLALINLVLAVFNMLPAYPLDGGRILRSLLWAIKGNVRWATRVASTMGSGFGIFLIVMGIYNVLFVGNFIGGMWWFLIGLFLYNAAQLSYQQLITRRALEGESVRRFMKRDPVTISGDTPLDRLVEDYVYRYHHKMYPVVSESGKVEGCVTTRQVKEIPKEQWNQKQVSEIAQPCNDENTIEPDTDAIKALSLMNQTGVSRLLVMENDRLVGVITLKDLLDFLSLRVELDE